VTSRAPPLISPPFARPPGQQSIVERLDWNLLRWFLVIVQKRSLSRAAAALFVTQSAVSQALKRLEEQVGCQLIDRQGHRFQLTRAGELTVRAGTEIFEKISRLTQECTSIDNQVVGQVSLLAVSRIASSAYDEFLAQFRQKYPRIRLDVAILSSTHIISALLRNTVAFGLIVSRSVPKLSSFLFLKQRWAVYCGKYHPLFGKTGLSASDLKSEDFVSFSSEQMGDALSPLIIFREQQGFFGNSVATSSDLDEVVRFIYTGFGIGCLPQHIAKNLVAEGQLWPLPPAQGVVDVPISLAWHTERKMNMAELAFLTSFKRHMSAIPYADRLIIARKKHVDTRHVAKK